MLALGIDAKLVAAAVIGGYLLGTIPFGVLVMKAAGAGDPRDIGSGNIGATNVLRSGRRDLAGAWPLGLAAGATWLAVAYFLRISSLAALTSAALAPLLALLVFDQPYPVTALALFMAILIFVRHQENIRRLVKGEEPKIGAKKPAPEAGQ